MKFVKLVSILSIALLVSCSSNKNEEEGNTPEVKTVGLKGKFNSTTDLDVVVSQEMIEDHVFEDYKLQYVTSYPFNQLTGFGRIRKDYNFIKWNYDPWGNLIGPQYGEGETPAYQWRLDKPDTYFRYNYEQALTLYADMTYRYSFTVTFGNPGQWRVLDMMSIDVDVNGVYTYTRIDDDNFTVTLSSPISGSESFYGCDFPLSSLSDFGWDSVKKHGNPDKVIEFDLLNDINMSEIDWYVRSRTIKVSYNRAEPKENSLVDNLYSPNFLEDISKYCTYY